ncbi:MAG: transketolase [Ignavibacteria bacterium]|nr:transketolase [Ignavibacteria bacterium]
MTYEELLEELIYKDDRIVIVTAENRAVLRNIPNKIGDKFIDTGITEQTLVGVSAGLALRGRIPVSHALATFLTMRAFEFIRTDVGIGNLPVKLVGGFPGFLSEANGPTHQAIEDVSIMRGIPNVNVFCPADNEDLLICLQKVIESSNPFYIRFNNSESVIKHNNDFEIGKAEVISKGSDVVILVYGVLFSQAYNAKKNLEKEGYSVGLLNIRTPKPIDEQLILETAMFSKLIVTIEDHFITGGLFSILGEIFLRNKITCDVFPISLENRWFKPLLFNDILRHEGFTGNQIAERIKKHIQK